MTTSENPTQTRSNPTVATLASFVFPGAGQVYNGQLGKGIIYMFAFWILAIPGILLSWLIVPFFIWMFLWLYIMVDAYRVAKTPAGE